MKIRVKPGKVSGEISAISSKSHAHRLLICAALSDKPTKIACKDVSEDIACTADCLRALCADIVWEEGMFFVTPRTPSHEALIDCGESGSTYRFLLPVAAALGGEYSFRLHGRLPQRPMDILFDLLRKQGIIITGEGSELVSIQGRLSGGRVSIAGNISSQFISGLMLCAPLTKKQMEISLITPLQSSAYVDITLAAAKQFSVQSFWDGNCLIVPAVQNYYSPGEVQVEGDWSNAAFWLSAVAAGGSRMSLSGLSASSPQGDKRIIDFLHRFGAKVKTEEDIFTVEQSQLQGCSIDIDATPDLAPELALLGMAAIGETIIHNIARLRLKESDRAISITQTLKALGGDISLEQDTIRIQGKGSLRGGHCEAHGDHRIAMMAACAAVLCDEDVVISGAEAVSKSYPSFFKDLALLGMPVQKEA